MDMNKGFELPKKDMKTVAYYNKQRQLEIFKGQCFNNASVLLSNYAKSFSAEDIFDLAQKLYDEGIKRDWLNIQKNEML